MSEDSNRYSYNSDNRYGRYESWDNKLRYEYRPIVHDEFSEEYIKSIFDKRKQLENVLVKEVEDKIYKQLFSSMPTGGQVIMNIEQIKQLDVKACGLEHALAVKIFLRDLKEELQELDTDVPAWIDEKLKVLTEHTKNLVRQDLEKKLKEAKEKYETLLTAEEKRAKAVTEIAKLEKKLE